MAKSQESYYGNYRGIVKAHDVNGMCKIFVPGVYPEEFGTDFNSLPLAEPCQPLFAGGASFNGVFQYPDINSTVWLFFESGNINYPVFFGATNNDKTNFKSDEFTIKYENDIIKISKIKGISIETPKEVTVNGASKVNILSAETAITSKVTITGDTSVTGKFTVAGNTDINGNTNSSGYWSLDRV